MQFIEFFNSPFNKTKCKRVHLRNSLEIHDKYEYSIHISNYYDNCTGMDTSRLNFEISQHLRFPSYSKNVVVKKT